MISVKIAAVAALTIVSNAVDVRAYSFLTVGDWGGHALEKTQYKNNNDFSKGAFYSCEYSGYIAYMGSLF